MDIGSIQSVDIDEQMRTAYLDYAMSVIVARALPDVRDGLKPVHRRILFAMNDLGLHPNTAYKKSARIVGEVLGKYHPHGDLAVYDAMARMAQDFSMRYPLVSGQGNFGSIDGDSPAAMRYTEARLAHLAEELLADIDKDTVDFGPNFDSTLEEPQVLPSRLPNMLLNGSSGIAVGMATSIPPHNLREVVAGVNFLIDNYDHVDDITADDLLRIIPGPDFPTGGVIVGRQGIVQAYTTGRSRIIVRGTAKIEEQKSGRYNIVITEIPYQVNKTGLIERIAELVREGRLDQIADMRDESDRRGMSIVIELKRSAQPRKVLNQLFKYTTLQSTFSVQMLALVKGQPRLLPLKRSLQLFIEHRQEVIERRSRFELDKARARAHILDGLLIALANLDAVIRTIRESPDVETAKSRLVERFQLSEIQAQAILDMQLRRLAALERQKIEEEHQQVLERIAYLEDLLASPHKILQVIKSDLEQLAEQYGDNRRTLIAHDAKESFSEEDLVEDEPTLINLTARGYIKRVDPSSYRVQHRGGRGVLGQGMREEDEVVLMLSARTLETVLFFTDRGKVYSVKTHEIPEASRTDRGTPAINVVNMEADERITAAVAVETFDKAYCTMVTERGRIKRVPLREFAAVRPSGLIAISLNSGDSLGWARLTSGEDDIFIVTAGGMAIRISENDVRPMGRQAAGVLGIRLGKTDVVTSMEVADAESMLLVVTEKGYGKRTDLSEYRTQSRGGKGVATTAIHALDEIGRIASARMVKPTDELTLISSLGQMLRIRVAQISTSGRPARGVRVMNLDEGDRVASIARLAAEPDPRETEDIGDSPAAAPQPGEPQLPTAEEANDTTGDSDE